MRQQVEETVAAPLVTSAGRSRDPLADAADSHLARRAKLGDRAAFAALVHRHGPAMFRYALHMLDGHVADSQDAVQSAWLKAWQNIDSFRGQAQLHTWLFRIVANEVHNARRRRRPVPVNDDLLAGAPADRHAEPADSLETEHLRRALAAALSELPWRQRASWLLREMEGLSYDDIAEVLNTTPTVVRGQLHRARRTLATRMVQW